MAGAIEWPGWCRGGRTEDEAMHALLEYGPRYERVLRTAGIDFQTPADVSAFEVVERLKGTATTDFGVADVAPSGDAAPVDDAELHRQKALLEACWAAFDTAVQVAHGRDLRKGPRGGGRDLTGVVGHVTGAEASYLKRLGGKPPDEKYQDGPALINQQRRIILETLDASARGEIPTQGPRGSVRWTPRYFVRRAAWHVLDHVWEIEDRIV
ncbi:MAG TPA: hypothetical protein VLQ48_00590 [Chloroflexia bacterium]|nr:hypothetical protein [Chloroflexia bacterium]